IMTADDLAAFRRNAAIAGKSFVGGITARQVIDHPCLSIGRRPAGKFYGLCLVMPVKAKRAIYLSISIRMLQSVTAKPATMSKWSF
ncbi:hypothetical protein B7G60_14670, partial [Staphylococcus aureus]